MLESDEVKKLKKKADDLVAAFECTQAGVWINNNKTLLVVVGVVAALAGTAALYMVKTGGGITSLAEGKGFTKKIGRITFDGKILKLDTTKQEVGLKLAMGADFKRLQFDTSISGVAAGPAAKVAVDGTIILPLGDGVKATAAGKSNGATSTRRLDSQPALQAQPRTHRPPGCPPSTPPPSA